MKLIDLGFRMMAIAGLGLGSFANIATPLSTGGAVYQRSIPQQRQFVLVGALTGNTLPELERARTRLVEALTPNRTPTQQELLLRYHRVNECTGDETEVIDIPCMYEGGLEGSIDSLNQQRLGITFRQFLPALYSDGEQAAELDVQTSVSNFAYIGYRDTDGTWKAMGTGITGGEVNVMRVAADGTIYVGGAFTGAGGVANTANIARWTGTAWQAVGTGLNGTVLDIAIGPDGSVYVAGFFTDAGGVLDADYIAKWNGSAWSALGTLTNAVVRALKFDQAGNLYAGGDFVMIGGVAANRIAKWNGSAFSAMAGLTTAPVFVITVSPDGVVYEAGADTAASPDVYVQKWDGSAWQPIGTYIGQDIRGMAFGPDGRLYAVGEGFDLGSFGNSVTFAVWNGTAWTELPPEMYIYATTLLFAPNGDLLLGGWLQVMEGTSVLTGATPIPDGGIVWRNGAWHPFDVDVQDTNAIYNALLLDPAGRFYIGGSWTGSTALSGTITVNVNGNDRAWPIFEFTGPGDLWQVKNYSSGNAIYFKGLTLLANEKAILNTDPLHFSFTSNFRGDLQSYIQDGTSTNLYLAPGSNSISVFMTSTTAASVAALRWRPVFITLDAATR